MRSWSAPSVPRLETSGKRPTIYSTSHRGPVRSPKRSDEARLYVCGITPYDATHLGHAATYVAFDTLHRVWLDAGIDVTYVQNTTDVDDPLLERATATGVDWEELAHSQIDLFRSDMEALRVIPPKHYRGVVESVDEIATAVAALVDSGAAYSLESGDVYYRVSTEIEPPFGSESHLDRKTMEELFAERGGDPDTPGKEDPLDPLLWRAAREGEPSWPGGSLPDGRPGWHIECSVIAQQWAGLPLTVQGGGSDLIFPHHEMSSAHATALTGKRAAKATMHVGMVGYEGEKMSKSKGNLVLVSELTKSGIDPAAVRLHILDHHYRSDWMHVDGEIDEQIERLADWRDAASAASGDVSDLVKDLRAALADDLDTPRALEVVDDWAETTDPSSPADAGTEEFLTAVDALLGIDLRA